MAHVDIDHVTVTFPIYGAGARSIKRTLLRMGATGGRIVRAEQGAAVAGVRALEDVSLHCREGDRVALIGHNGSGKSTLLRVAAGIYEPDAGTVSTSGKKVPLFNVSLGMDMDSTGYENIVLRALYMGMSRREVERLIPEIADFSGLEGYLHLPLRTYSAGMRIRLAFSVVTSVPADILLIDEGLGTGDAAFVEQASSRVKAFSEQAPIVLLAAHNPSLLRQMCNQAVLLHHGRMMEFGPLESVLKEYRALSKL